MTHGKDFVRLERSALRHRAKYIALRLASALAKREGDFAEGTKRSTLEQLADWTLWADKTLVF